MGRAENGKGNGKRNKSKKGNKKGEKDPKHIPTHEDDSRDDDEEITLRVERIRIRNFQRRLLSLRVACAEPGRDEASRESYDGS